MADIYIIRPDGSGLKKITESGNFCGSPKWTGDSRHIVAYCMTAEQTLANRQTESRAGQRHAAGVDRRQDRSVDRLSRRPGRQNQSVAARGNEIGYIRKDTAGPRYLLHKRQARTARAHSLRLLVARW